MEFVVNKRDFVKALGRVQSVADKRSPMPILSNVLIRAEASGAVHFAAKVRLDTPQEVEYYRHGGILQYVLRQLLAS